MSKLKEIRDSVLRQIRPIPSEVEKGFRIFNHIKQSIQEVAEKKEVELAFINLEGSSGRKQTQLRNHRELDIFIGISPDILSSLIKTKQPKKPFLRKFFKKLVIDIGLDGANQAGCHTSSIAYAEHPYVTVSFDDYKADIVFCFDLTPEFLSTHGPITAVDRTPHHTRFVDQHLTERQRDDVRLLKAFLLSTFVYGDASPVGRSGFTGFSTEMIIYHHADIEGALKFLAQPQPEPLDIHNRSVSVLRKRFARELLIITDPTDSNRNIAASISERAYRFSQHKAASLLQNPTESYFAMQPIPILSIDELHLLGPNYFVIEFRDDTGWHYTKTRDKLYRYFVKLQKFLNREPTGEPRFGSTIFEEIFQEPYFAIALHVNRLDIGKSYKRVGPSPQFVEGTEEFLKKHPDAFLKDGRYQAEITRIFTNAEQAIHHFLTTNPLSKKLTLMNISNHGSTTLGKQALWILSNAILPYITPKNS
ncbi:MAG: hypothetical protein ACFFD8_00910 [Candidatus Thorarchaeota archaeon]